MSPESLLALLASFDWDKWNQQFADEYSALFRRMVDSQGKRAGDLLDVKWDGHDPFLSRWLTSYVGERIVTLDTTTRDEVTDLLRATFAANEGTTTMELGTQVAEAVREQFAGYERWRADRIARTESAIALNNGTLFAARQGGLNFVVVSDGGGDASCDECDAVDGQVWTLEQAMANPVEHPNAVMAGTRVLPLGAIKGGYRALWAGPVVHLVTASAVELAIGPNHPVLTSRGWVAAKNVRVGDDVIRCVLGDGSDRATQGNFDYVPPMIEQVFQTLRSVGDDTRIVASAGDFHGDGQFCQGDVEVVRPNRLLGSEEQAALLEQAGQASFVVADAEAAELARLRASGPPCEGVPLAPSGGVCSLDVRGVIARLAQLHAEFDQAMSDRSVACPETVRDLACRFPGLVALDQIVRVSEIKRFVGHAFDLHTSSSAYLANGIVTHNCRRSFLPTTDEDAADLMNDAEAA